MKAYGLLMIEHRLIEKMIKIIKERTEAIKTTCTLDAQFIDTAVDFIRIYADKTHHGKEEDILFRDLAKKSLSKEDSKLMAQLLREHKYSRKTTAELVLAKENYLKGDEASLAIVQDKLKALAKLYPSHIKKEDAIFFPHAEKYLSKDELMSVLCEFYDFDKNMIHFKYKLVVEQLKNKE